MATLDFERPLLELQRRIADLKHAARASDDLADEIERLEERARLLQREMLTDLATWDKVQLCRHADRPTTLDYLSRLVEDFLELHGDRAFADDRAIVGGLARFRGRRVLVVGHQKGHGMKEAVARNFGQPHPEGFRKSRRLMELADNFGLPVLTFIDSQGAYPGLGAEERGQAEAIGQAMLTMARLRVPVLATVLGEGGSGGALALGVANRLLMLEYATLSVISPEGCASILWKDSAKAAEAADTLRITATHVHRFGIADEVVEEPPGGAHRNADEAALRLGEALARHLDELCALSPEALVEDRYRKYRAIGVFG